MDAAKKFIEPEDDPELALLAELGAAVTKLYKAAKGPAYSCSKKKQVSLHKKCLELKLKDRELYELQINCEMILFVLSTLQKLEIEPDRCHTLMRSLSELPKLLASPEQSPFEEHQRVVRVEELYSAIDSLESNLQGIIGENRDNEALIAPLLKDFQTIRTQLKNSAHKQLISSNEQLAEFKKSWSALKKAPREEIEIQWRVLQMQSLCEKLISIKPAKPHSQLLSHHVSLFLRALSKAKPMLSEYYQAITDDLISLTEEIISIRTLGKQEMKIVKNRGLSALMGLLLPYFRTLRKK